MKCLRSVLFAIAAGTLCASVAHAQGVTSAAIAGTVTDDAGNAVVSATVGLTNTATGQRIQTRTGNDGRYFFENLEVGGPYTLEFRGLGFKPMRVAGLLLVLGQRLVIDQVLERVAIEVQEITVAASDTNPFLNTARTGAQSLISGTFIDRLPTLSRNFTDFVSAVPQVVTSGVPGASIGGQNNRFNIIQIDGGVNNDLFGLAASGTPGGQANAHPITVEALKEYQVMIAPFDVRQGSFAGGLINAVTKSGSNEYHGSIFGYTQNETFVGDNQFGNPVADFLRRQYGFTASGPIVRNRLQFFVAAEWQHRERPFAGSQLILTDTTGGADSVGVGIRLPTAQAVERIAQTTYGFEPGGFAAPLLRNPDKNLFGKLSFQLSTNHQLELSHNYVDAGDDNLIRNSTATGFRDGYQLSNSGYEFTSKTNTSRAKFTSQVGRASNELLLGLQSVRDKRALPNRIPLIFVGGERAGTNVAIGADRFSHDNSLDQDIVEVTDNFTLPVGAHTVTIGTHNEFFGFLNHFFPASLGVWNFTDTTAFAAGTASRYEIALPLRPQGPTAEFDVRQYGFYVQDRWQPVPKLRLTAGLRVDIPAMDKPTRNPALDSIMGINTGDFPSGNALWSPRLGVNYDVHGDGSSFLRGGIGVFSGRPPYVWISNAFGNTGLEQATLICDGGAAGYLDTVPAFTVDPNNQPTQCGGGLVGAAQATPSIVYFDNDFKFPQNLKIAAGLDQKLPWHVSATFDLLYTRAINQFYISDVNLQGITGYVQGEGGRPRYGTLSATSTSATPARRTSSFRDVLRHRNESADRSFSISGELRRSLGGQSEARVAYTYAHTEDLFSLGSSIAFSNFRFTALDGTLEDRNLRTSVFDIPHKITATGIFGLPYGFLASISYIGQSGHPYTYVVQSDANGDGVTQNDIAYIPRNRADISMDGNGGASGFGTAAQQDSAFTLLDTYINGEECLRKARGTVPDRNSCRNPWISFINARITKQFYTFGPQRLELSLDVFNVLHLLNDTWGVIRETTAFEQTNLVNRTGFDAVNNRGVYALALPIRYQKTFAPWQVQFGMKYAF